MFLCVSSVAAVEKRPLRSVWCVGMKHTEAQRGARKGEEREHGARGGGVTLKQLLLCKTCPP